MEILGCQSPEHTADTRSFTGKQRCLGTELKTTYASHVWIGVEREWQSEEIYAKLEETAHISQTNSNFGHVISPGLKNWAGLFRTKNFCCSC